MLLNWFIEKSHNIQDLISTINIISSFGSELRINRVLLNRNQITRFKIYDISLPIDDSTLTALNKSCGIC